MYVLFLPVKEDQAAVVVVVQLHPVPVEQVGDDLVAQLAQIPGSLLFFCHVSAEIIYCYSYDECEYCYYCYNLY